MSLQRGDVALADLPFVTHAGASPRACRSATPTGRDPEHPAQGKEFPDDAAASSRACRRVTRPGSKLRPVLVVQNDTNNERMENVIVAFISTNIARSHLPTQVLIDVSTPIGQQSGRIANSSVTCENLITIRQSPFD